MECDVYDSVTDEKLMSLYDKYESINAYPDADTTDLGESKSMYQVIDLWARDIALFFKKNK